MDKYSYAMKYFLTILKPSFLNSLFIQKKTKQFNAAFMWSNVYLSWPGFFPPFNSLLGETFINNMMI